MNARFIITQEGDREIALRVDSITKTALPFEERISGSREGLEVIGDLMCASPGDAFLRDQLIKWSLKHDGSSGQCFLDDAEGLGFLKYFEMDESHRTVIRIAPVLEPISL